MWSDGLTSWALDLGNVVARYVREHTLYKGIERVLTYLVKPTVCLLLSQLSIVPIAKAQHATDNAVLSADDAFGLTLGTESIGIYSPGCVRGFNPQGAGDVRIDGLYFDNQAPLSGRVIEQSVIRVAISEIGYVFPAPTGIVDYGLRRVSTDKPFSP